MSYIEDLKFNKIFPTNLKTNKKFSRQELLEYMQEVEEELEKHVGEGMVLFTRNIRVFYSSYITLQKDASGFYGVNKYVDLTTNTIKSTRVSLDVASLISLQSRLLFLEGV